MGALCRHKTKGSLVGSPLSGDGDGDGYGYGVHVVVVTLLLWVTAVGRTQVAVGQLAVDFYASSCPGAERIITTAVRTASVVDPVLPAKILRLFFHDCFVEGCDGSLLLDSAGNQTAEKDDPINKTVEGYNLVDGIKRSMELLCPGIVSCADIVALAASAAVLQVGGPNMRIATGRLDGRVSNGGVVRFNLPDTNFDLDMLLKFFGAKGLDLTDIVTLAGAHTIGVAHCDAFNDRIVFNNSVAQVDPTMNPNMVAELISKCPAQADPSTTVSLDTTTPSTFDNAYFSNLQTGRGLMTADQTLFTDPRSKPTVERFANDRAAFFASWVEAFTKLSMVNVKTGTDPSGEIRKTCRVINS